MDEAPRSTQKQSSRDRYRDEIWSMAGEWTAKIEKAYDAFARQKEQFRRIVVVDAIVFAVAVVILGLLAQASRALPYDNFLRSDTAFSMSVAIVVLVSTIFAFDIFRRLQQLKFMRNDLKDLSVISEDLFNMIISTEERRSTENKYEYLVNHIRVLEIRHLLRKVERAINDKSDFI